MLDHNQSKSAFVFGRNEIHGNPYAWKSKSAGGHNEFLIFENQKARGTTKFENRTSAGGHNEIWKSRIIFHMESLEKRNWRKELYGIQYMEFNRKNSIRKSYPILVLKTNLIWRTQIHTETVGKRIWYEEHRYILIPLKSESDTKNSDTYWKSWKVIKRKSY